MLVRPLVRVRSKRLSQNTPHYKFCADQAHEISCLPPRPTRERLANCSNEAIRGWLARYHHSKRVSSDLSHRSHRIVASFASAARTRMYERGENDRSSTCKRTRWLIELSA